jgi:hypothetical protein
MYCMGSYDSGNISLNSSIQMIFVNRDALFASKYVGTWFTNTESVQMRFELYWVNICMHTKVSDWILFIFCK